jgi:signal transduction histidine kinase
MLTLNRSESNKIIFSPQLTDLENFGKKIVEDFKPILHQKENLKYLFSLKEKEYSIDRNLLSVILNNLISNAIKYSKEKIEISLVFSEDKDNITFMVADKGMGINKEDINNIFQPFYRTAKSETIKGTGLGLSIVKNYVELHKGKITVESEPNNGSTFFVSIPKLKLNGK